MNCSTIEMLIQKMWLQFLIYGINPPVNHHNSYVTSIIETPLLPYVTIILDTLWLWLTICELEAMAHLIR